MLSACLMCCPSNKKGGSRRRDTEYHSVERDCCLPLDPHAIVSRVWEIFCLEKTKRPGQRLVPN